MWVPFIVYADFWILHITAVNMSTSCDKSYTKRNQKHTPSGFCYKIKCFDDTLYSQEPVTFVKEHNDDDAAQIFIDTLEKNIKDIYTRLSSQKVW